MHQFGVNIVYSLENVVQYGAPCMKVDALF
jgi:hypothetical protein